MRLSILPLVLALSACSFTPVLEKPDAPVPVSYPSVVAQQEQASAAEIGWVAMFGDPRLQQLIDLALKNNRDLRLATLNVEAVQAEYRIGRAARLPSVEAGLGGARERALDPTSGQGPSTQNRVDVQLGVTAFELDLWGRVRSMSEAAFARYLASDEGRRAARISLIASVADAYIAQRLATEQLELARQTLRSWTEQLDLAQQLYRARQSSRLDLAQVRSQVSRAQADAEARARDLQRSHNALFQLVGAASPPSSLPKPLPLQRQPVLTRLPAGLPSTLLLYRPDIRQAEQNLKAANADIGAARAAFLPRISLTATAGFASPSMRGLFGSEHRVWSFAPQITQPLFDGGRLRAELRLSELRKSSAIAEYERAIQVAFREVADGLAGTATYARQIAAQEEIVAEETKRAELSEQRYRAGIDGRLELLDAQRQLYAARQELLDLRRDEFGNAIALYKALGGGQFRDEAREQGASTLPGMP
ncbi:efflux transporter outer membrane subunit [Massilia sp.]|uniref:efflux transporter outer membrane subunit n=1 Tax=Massilia sp. TaxID=1882437 RepID=UPI0028AAC4C0|nr:efflux transporter outer membrane subunit [Massilia sp.]